MAKPWRWISTDIGIAADLPSPYAWLGGDMLADRPVKDLAGGGRQGLPAGTQPRSGLLFCDWIKLRPEGARRRT